METRPAIGKPTLPWGISGHSVLSTGRCSAGCRAISDCEQREGRRYRCRSDRSLMDTCLALGSGSTHELNPRPG